MKTLLFLFIASLLLSCDRNGEATQSETEYQKYVTEIKNISAERLRKMNDPEAIKTAYQESGLNNLILGIDNLGGKAAAPNAAAFWNFYQQVIVEKYADNEHQEALKSKAIWYAVTEFNLLEKDDKESREHLLAYTRDLVSNRHHSNFQLAYDCIFHIRSSVSKEEFNKMIKTQRFAIRFLLTDITEAMKKMEQNPEAPGAKDEFALKTLKGQADLLNKLDSDFEQLIIKD